jgi:ABC-type amino acid transport substrate-binding protein
MPGLLSGRSDVMIVDMSTILKIAKKVNFTDPWMVDKKFISP